MERPIKEKSRKNRKVILSILWVFVLINMIYADIIGMLKPGYTESLDKISRELTPETVLLFSVLMEFPIIMVLLSYILNRRVNRMAHFIAVPVSILWVVVPSFISALGTTPVSYIFFASIEVTTMLFIFYYVWKWPEEIIHQGSNQ